PDPLGPGRWPSVRKFGRFLRAAKATPREVREARFGPVRRRAIPPTAKSGFDFPGVAADIQGQP
ncbi:MAG TPA: hypothetical protein PLS03_15370, partial [Terrimicrobiaceae bacterium]|nr:hypothetical protein [Terrimicrobiaceae bacterium]